MIPSRKGAGRTGAVVGHGASVVRDSKAEVLAADAAVNALAVEVLVELCLERGLCRAHKARLLVKKQQQAQRLFHEKVQLEKNVRDAGRMREATDTLWQRWHVLTPARAAGGRTLSLLSTKSISAP